MIAYLQAMSSPFIESDAAALRGKALWCWHLVLLLLIIPMLLLARQEGDSLQVGSQPDSVQVGGQPDSVQVGSQPDSVQEGSQPDSVQEGGQPDTLAIQAPDSALTGPLFHNPPMAILNDRPFQIDFFVIFDPDTIESISLVFRDDSSHTYKEIPLEGEYGRYRYVLPVEELRGSTLTYYFLVVLRDYGLWAYPTGEDGVLQPFVIDLIPPIEEFFQKRYYE